MNPDNKATPSSILALPCPSCGSKLQYSAEKKMIVCNHCGHNEAVNEAQDRVVEIELKEAIENSASFMPEASGQQVHECQNCGSEFILDAHIVNITCSFCGSKKVNQDAQTQKYIQPAGMIAFQIPEKEAIEKFRKWIKKGWFRPNKLNKLADNQALHAVYVPFWTFDAQTETDYTGQAGFHYYVTESYNTSDGMKTRQVQKTRWEFRAGHISHFFDDILVVAANGIKQGLLEQILPFNLQKVVNYDPRLLVGWETEVYNLELQDGYKKGEVIIDKKIRALVEADIGGDVQRVSSINSFKFQQTFKHILLPIWVCSYMYRNKLYQFAINGQTGKIKGKKPLSWFKIVGLILFIAAIIIAIFLIKDNI